MTWMQNGIHIAVCGFVWQFCARQDRCIYLKWLIQRHMNYNIAETMANSISHCNKFNAIQHTQFHPFETSVQQNQFPLHMSRVSGYKRHLKYHSALFSVGMDLIWWMRVFMFSFIERPMGMGPYYAHTYDRMRCIWESILLLHKIKTSLCVRMHFLFAIHEAMRVCQNTVALVSLWHITWYHYYSYTHQ